MLNLPPPNMCDAWHAARGRTKYWVVAHNGASTITDGPYYGKQDDWRAAVNRLSKEVGPPCVVTVKFSA